MPLVFHYSKINLNMTAKSIRTGLPLRIFDILSCGGFCLTNYQTELTDYFTPGVDLDYYTSEDDLLSKVDYYLSHEKERKEIASNGLLTASTNHNYPERLLQMLSLAYGITEGDL
jgi:spore maturation protein CgeB